MKNLKTNKKVHLIVPKKHGPCFRKMATSYNRFKQFALITSLPGCKFFGEERSLLEKLFWIIVLTSVLVLCGFQIYFLWDQYNSGKIITSQKITRRSVRNTPFPAITVCNENQLNQSKLIYAKEELEASEYRGLNSYIDVACQGNVNHSSNIKKKIHHSSLEYVFKNLSVECNKIFLKLYWMNMTIENPCDYAQPIVLEMGLCFSLNMVPHESLFSRSLYLVLKSYWRYEYHYEGVYESSTWSPADGYSNDTSDTPPWRVAGMGQFNGILLIADSHPKNFKNHCNISDYGLTVFVHSPIDYPQPINSLYIRPNAWNKVMVTPRLVSNSKTLRSWNPIARNCFYQHERPLKFFKIYSLNNCQIECRANKTRQLCGCVSHFDPRTKYTPVCSPSQWECIVHARSTKFSIFGNRSAADEHNNYTSACLCLPSCTEYSYSLVATKMIRNFSYIGNIDNSFSTDDIGGMTILFMYFKHNEVDERVRFALTRFHELIANIGGVMSLCIGCSIISLFEIIYFMAFRKIVPVFCRENQRMTIKQTNSRHDKALKSYREIRFTTHSRMVINKF